MAEIEDQLPFGVDGSKALNPETFGSVLGQAVWLMTMSADHKELPIKVLESRILPALLLKQFKLYFKGKQPVAFLTWASLSETAAEKLDSGALLELEDWRSGENLTIVDCVSPFTGVEGVKRTFMKGLARNI